MFHLKRILATTLAIGALAIIGMAVLPQQSAQANGHKEFKKVHCEKYLKKCELTGVKELRGKELRAADDLYQIDALSFVPVATIDSPAHGSTFQTNHVSDRSCMAGGCSSQAVGVTLVGHATDSEDGNLTGINLTWTVQGGSGRLLLIGTGEVVTVNLFLDGGAPTTSYDITLSATDSDGNVDTETITVTLFYGL